MYKVVVVEDESIVRQGIVRSTNWSSIDCMVVGEAENGEVGYEVIKRLNPDVVITDIRMPKMTGIRMIEKLREEDIKPVTIFLTAYDDFDYAIDALRLRASDYVLKPFEDNVLEAAVTKALTNIKRKSDNKAEILEQENLSLSKGDKSKYLAAALSFIDEHYMDPELSAKMVSDALNISTGHLSHLFRKESEYTMSNYILDCRMRAAKDLLKDYTHKVYEVAEKVGYKDITYFSATFKKYVGVSPSEYQDRYRAQ